jgi:alkylation response protein AidB-like acyl-CoA dehydrogenase
MLTSFGDDQATEFRLAARDWLKTAVRPEWKDGRLEVEEGPEMMKIRGEWDTVLWEGGFAGLSWPAEYGGRGLGPIEDVIFLEECAAAGAPSELNTLGKHLAGPALITHGSTAQKERHLRAILSNREFWCEGFSEPDAGSDMASVLTTARRDGRGWHLTGQKIWTTFSPIADRCYVLARTSDTAPRRQNLSVFLVDMHAPGVEVVPIRQITGIRQFGQVFFDVDVPDDDLLGEPGQGWELASLVGAHRTAGAALGASGRWADIDRFVHGLRACAAETGNTGVLGRIAELAEQASLVKWHVRVTTELCAQDRPWRSEQSVLKLVWSRLAQECTEVGLELMCDEHEAFWRNQYLDSRKHTIAGGTSQLQRNVIADRVLALPR